MSGTIQKTIALFKSAFEGLHVDVPANIQEKLGIMVNKAMSSQARSFHTPQHIFDLVDAKQPIITLAALFHDIVYYQIDKGFIPEILKHLRKYVHIRAGRIAIYSKDKSENLLFSMTMKVFGFSEHQKLSPFNGMNEFLSALVMNSALAKYISLRHLLKATACIEATIPFRGLSEDGKRPSELLAERIVSLNRKQKLDLSLRDIDDIVQCAVNFANRDVLNFAESNVARFLDNTWKLLPETNPALRVKGIFTVHEYLTALKNMEQFMNFLKPENIFASYKGSPDKKRMKLLTDRAGKNVSASRDYLGFKLLASALLEALASISGGDAPISLFMGDISRDDSDLHFEDLLPEASNHDEVATTIHDLLSVGRASETSFDLKNSPLANYIYSSLGDRQSRKLLALARQMLKGEISARRFLDSFPEKMLVPLLKAFSEMAFTRKQKIAAYIARRKKKK
ncbi:MAG: hypothetical protein JW874_16390 [Spirochaetales bacterium]|nr:hypothetical protein [Spirochaetales bacterium]